MVHGSLFGVMVRAWWRTTAAALCVMVCLGASTVAYAQAATITVGYFDLPPHGSSHNGQADGAAIAYFKLVAKEMGVTPRFVRLPLARLLLTPQLDMVLYLGKNPERSANFVFAKQALMRMEGGIAVPTASALKRADTADDLLGLQIGVWDAGYRGALMQDPRLTLRPLPSETLLQRGVQMVALQRLDGFYNPEARSLHHAIRALQLQSKVRVVILSGGAEGLYPAFTKASAPRYLQRFEKAFAQVQTTQRYDDFLNQYQPQ